MEDRAIIDVDSGEVVNVIRTGDRILRKESIEIYKKISSPLNSRHFVRVDQSECKLILPELTPYERSVLFTLQLYVSYDTGLICHINGKEMGFDDIIALTGLSRGQVSKTINNLIAKDLIYRGKNSKKIQYFMNPWIANKGVVVNPTLKEMFKHYKIRSKGNVEWKDLHE